MVKMGEIEANKDKWLREISILKKRKEGIDKQVNKLLNEQKELENSIINISQFIESLKEDEIKISYHAWVRYFERIEGFDLEKLEKEILTSEIKERIKTLGDGTYKNVIKNGKLTLIVKNNNVVTILD
jgi:hypothetical protein